MKQDEIIQKIKAGGQAELSLVYETHRGEFLHWIAREFNCTDDDAKDIYQLTILIFYDNIKQGKLEHLVSSVKTYLFGIGKNVMMDQLRKSKRYTPLDKERWLKDHLMDEPDPAPQDTLLSMAQNALVRLGDPCQQLIEMFYYGRKSMEDITEILDYKNTETTKNQKCKCMKRLRKLFEEERSKTLMDIAYEP